MAGDQRRCGAAALGNAAAIIFLLWQMEVAKASDPELLDDFWEPTGAANTRNGTSKTHIGGDFFTFTGFRGGRLAAAPPGAFQGTKCTLEEFPALRGLGISLAFMEFQPGGLNAPHTHPRATELVYVLEGSLSVAFLDTNSTLYSQTLLKGDVFAFPKGMLHYIFNPSSSSLAHALASFSSAHGGRVEALSSLFGSGIPTDVLVKALNASRSNVLELQAAFFRHS